MKLSCNHAWVYAKGCQPGVSLPSAAATDTHSVQPLASVGCTALGAGKNTNNNHFYKSTPALNQPQRD